MSVTSSTFGMAGIDICPSIHFELLSPARGRGWERGLQTVFEAPSPSLSP